MALSFLWLGGLDWEDVRPLVRDRRAAKREAASLIAITDGLGVRVARASGGPARLLQEQRACRRVLDRALEALRPPR